jgi:hypothetical protein
MTSPVLMSLMACSVLGGVIRLPLPFWSSGPQRDLNQSGLSAGLAAAFSGRSS